MTDIPNHMQPLQGSHSFARMKEQAAKLYRENPSEVWRHASVSTDNRHRCRQCFTCACLETLQSRGKAGV